MDSRTPVSELKVDSQHVCARARGGNNAVAGRRGGGGKTGQGAQARSPLGCSMRMRLRVNGGVRACVRHRHSLAGACGRTAVHSAQIAIFTQHTQNNTISTQTQRMLALLHSHLPSSAVWATDRRIDPG